MRVQEGFSQGVITVLFRALFLKQFGTPYTLQAASRRKPDAL